MTRTAGTRITAWLGIFAICLAVFMPGVNALKNRYLSHDAVQGVTQDWPGSESGAADNLKDNTGSGGADIFLADICFGAQANAGSNSGSASGEHHGVLALTDSHENTDPRPASGHHSDHAAECLYCGFFSHNLPLMLSADLPAMSYGFVSRIALQHQHSSYYARPAFVPLSRAPPALS